MFDNNADEAKQPLVQPEDVAVVVEGGHDVPVGHRENCLVAGTKKAWDKAGYYTDYVSPDRVLKVAIPLFVGGAIVYVLGPTMGLLSRTGDIPLPDCTYAGVTQEACMMNLNTTMGANGFNEIRYDGMRATGGVILGFMGVCLYMFRKLTSKIDKQAEEIKELKAVVAPVVPQV